MAGLRDSPIAEAARSFIPITWDALLTDDSDRFNEELLQGWVDVVKEKLFGTVIPESTEENYPLRVIKYAGKMVARELITPGVDFWMSQLTSVTTTGTSEVESFTDRANRLELLGNRLGRELREEQADIYALLGTPVPSKRRGYIAVNTDEDDVLITVDPRTFPRLYREV